MRLPSLEANRAAYAAYFGRGVAEAGPLPQVALPAAAYLRRESSPGSPPEGPAPVYSLEGPTPLGALEVPAPLGAGEAVEALLRHLELESRRGSQPGEEE